MNDRDVLAAERLRDQLDDVRKELRRTYASAAGPVRSPSLKMKIGKLAEQWLVEIEPELRSAREIKPSSLANRSVAFERLLSYAERASRRDLYEKELTRILKDYRAEVVIRAKLALQPGARPLRDEARFVPTAFIGHSFAEQDKDVVQCVVGALAAVGIRTETGERPAADTVSAKVKRRIDAQHIFVGVFTRREKIAKRDAWTTSAWIIDEKAYAVARGKRLILLRETRVDQIGGLQGDQEYIDFDRKHLDRLAVTLMSMFEVAVTDFRP